MIAWSIPENKIIIYWGYITLFHRRTSCKKIISENLHKLAKIYKSSWLPLILVSKKTHGDLSDNICHIIYD